MLMATAFFRTIILYLLLIAGLRLTGKRQIGELEPIELVLTMLLSDLASVPMQDFDSPLINGVVPILTLLALTTLLSYISFRSGRFRSLICGEPAIVVRYGKLQQRAMRHNRMTVDELLEELRGQGVTDLKDVQYAVLETSGQVSVLLRPQAQPVTPRQLSLNVTEQLLPVLLINDGRLMSGQSVSRRLGGTRGSEREPFIEKSLAFFNKFIECSAGSGAPARPAAAAAGAAGPAPAAGRPPAAGGTGSGSGSASPGLRPGSRGG